VRLRFPFLTFCVLLACSGGGAQPRYLSIATGGTGGVYYPYGGGLAKVLSDALPNVRATAEVTAGSFDNLRFLRDGRADIAFTLADTLSDAVNARGMFAGTAPVSAESLAVLYSNYTHIVAQAAAPIRVVGDLRGKVVSTGAAGSGTEAIAIRILKAAGIDPARDVRRQALGVSESADALKDGKVDAFFWSGGLPTAAILDLSHAPGMRIRLIPSAEMLPSLRREFGELYFPLTIRANVYLGVDTPVPVVGVANVLVVNRSMDEQLAYDITRTLFERRLDLGAIHPEARNLSLESAVEGSPTSYHPGAVRFYREQGVWR
jgi:TRAP transporter TAXI family solute receptor